VFLSNIRVKCSFRKILLLPIFTYLDYVMIHNVVVLSVLSFTVAMVRSLRGSFV
jgi:hypothetical protein